MIKFLSKSAYLHTSLEGCTVEKQGFVFAFIYIFLKIQAPYFQKRQTILTKLGLLSPPILIQELVGGCLPLLSKCAGLCQDIEGLGIADKGKTRGAETAW